MKKPSQWQRRIRRSEELLEQHGFAAEMLRFYAQVARFQERLQEGLKAVASVQSGDLSRDDLDKLCARFGDFLSLVEAQGPAQLSEISRGLHSQREGWAGLFEQSWHNLSPSEPATFLTLAYLQPFAELRRAGASLHLNGYRHAICPFCSRKPGFGVLRPMGDGGARSMTCGFCLAEWEFRRIVCAGCGEENEKQLSVYTAEEFPHIRVECCDTCKIYIKSIDLTKNGHAEPLVDELASALLDLWAREKGYAKLQVNLLGM